MTDEQLHEAGIALHLLNQAADGIFQAAKKPEFAEFLWENRERIRAAQDDLRATLLQLAITLPVQT